MGSDDIAKAVKDARIAAAFSAFCVILIGLLFMVDGRRNKWIAEKIEQIQQIVHDFQVMAVNYAGAAAAAPGVGADPGDIRRVGGDGSAGVVADGAAGAGVDDFGDPLEVPVNGWPVRGAGLPGGPRGDG